MWKQGDLIQCRYLFVEKQLQVTFTLVSKGHKNLNDSLLPIIPTTKKQKQTQSIWMYCMRRHYLHTLDFRSSGLLYERDPCGTSLLCMAGRRNLCIQPGWREVVR